MHVWCFQMSERLSLHRSASQADADIPLPDEGPDGGVPSQADSRNVSDALSDDAGDVQQSNAASDDEGEDLLDNAAA